MPMPDSSSPVIKPLRASLAQRPPRSLHFAAQSASFLAGAGRFTLKEGPYDETQPLDATVRWNVCGMPISGVRFRASGA